jgi:hypothetical protein
MATAGDPPPADSAPHATAIDADAAVAAWLESLLAAARPEVAWTPEALSAALEWCAAAAAALMLACAF